ncbi:TatD family hydrolase [Ideonella livida]|uniref:TatD family hydrolase n=1 Tax=Ideonella livida TaxID=2707176 RepID=A0A7C9PG31_9BURK|nr:TatD family hydrolase [Ideonella livida]NDY90530.1 TatD family hydrolase [Ideonella livida]
MQFVDSHCHLSFPELRERLPEILQTMAQARVAAALCISTRTEEIAEVVALAEEDPRLWASAGVHPDTEDSPEPDLALLCEWARHPRVVALGETGLDYYRLNGRSVADMQWQRDRFQVHLEAARLTTLPLVIHTRNASQDTLSQLRALQGGVGGVFHCFTETAEVARAALDLGFMISFSGIVSFRNAADLREVARFVPLDRCLIETDSPYLAPVPHRGKVNQPGWVPHVAEVLAREKGLDLEAVAQATTANFEQLFGVDVQRQCRTRPARLPTPPAA